MVLRALQGATNLEERGTKIMEKKKMREDGKIERVWHLSGDDTARLKTYYTLLDDVGGIAQATSYEAYNSKIITDEARRECLEAARPYELSAELLRRLIAIETVRLHEHAFMRIRSVFDKHNESDAAIIAEVLENVLEGYKRRERELEALSRAERIEDF